MGLLDQVLGGLMGGSGGNASPMQGVLSSLLGGNQQQGSQQQGQMGGLGGLVSTLEGAGLGSIVQSWIGNGANQSISPQQLHGALGDSQVQSMASQAGLPANDFLSQLSQHLPNAVNAMTPQRPPAGRGQRVSLTTGLCRAAPVAAMLLALAGPAWAANPMGYQLLSQQDAAALPHNHGALGLDVDRGQQMTDDGMTFDVMRVKTVRPGSAAAQAGLKIGDQVIAMDGRVFPTILSFAAYVGSLPPGTGASIDYMPAGQGPQQAQRLSVTLGGAGAPLPAAAAQPQGMSTGTKVAIGVGAVALFGCYELGCFTHHPKPSPAPARTQPQP